MKDKLSNSSISVNIKFLIVGILSLVLIICDAQFSCFSTVRFYVESWMTPVYYIVDAPSSITRNVSNRFYTYEELHEENTFLKQQLREIRTDLLRYDSLIKDNEELRNLNNSPIKEDFRKLGAEVMMVDTNSFSQTIIINRGKEDGVYEGQPVINEEGVIGQVTSIANYTSRVLLLTDQNHSIPVIVMRNGIRAIASGTGVVNELSLVNMPRNVDIQVGDLLVSSGLGGKFPKGYPVGRVVMFDKQEGMQFADIKVQPLASLDRLRYMLLIWLPKSEQMNIDEINLLFKQTYRDNKK